MSLLSGRLRWLLLVVGLLVRSLTTPAQTVPPGTDYRAALKTQNLSRLWHADRLTFYGATGTVAFPEPLGFIGKDYQRFYLHYTSVQQDPANPLVYRVAGKTRVKSNVCAFTGTLTIVKALRYNAPNANEPQFREGELTCRVELAENRAQPGSGTIRGTLTTYFYLDKQGQARYNTLEAQADGWGNNQCVATWTSYATGQAKPCHWGDYRIAESGTLDIGAGEFSINDKYVQNGWQTYQQALLTSDSPHDPAGQRAKAEERRQWWK
ncbi:hypothetical protein Q5H93_06620 [Hymenobacter sp. ASUV-10]|uniref:Uncharacterized protein n=1 Tax=Hymenobacter aranciens TaxID=3063996 RepID=A0ABT9B846_9BACT|nr:hypothetical protein [Hymenobacter sp. ASUV-10]MDO7874400.1 hypothetical protein [Hymenobacter sp. ASUV-10]